MCWGRKLFFIAIALFLFSEISAQVSAGEFYSTHLQYQNTGMFILGVWAVANIATGVYGWSRYGGDAKYFHQMNLFWNTVNLGIAGFAIYNNMLLDPLEFGAEGALEEVRKLEKVLLINSGLDGGYIGAGFLLKHFASRSEKRKELLSGYGNSLILQGSFLLVFDLILYGFLHAQRMVFMEGSSLSLV